MWPFSKKTETKSANQRAAAPTGKPIGEVTHYYSHLGVAIVKFNKTVQKGERVHFGGAHTDFDETIKSIQYDHQDIEAAKKGQEVGIKVGEKVREGDKVYAAD